MQTAIIAGATGLVGSNLLDRLLTSYPQVISLVRRPTGARIEERITDFDRLHDQTFPEGSDVFCTLGTTIRKAGSQSAFRKVDLEYPVALAKRALDCGARQFLVVSSVGADNPGSNFYLQTKHGMEEQIVSLPFHAVHIFRPSLLVGDRAEARPGERIGSAVARALSFALIGSLTRYKPITASDVANAMVAAAGRADPGVHIHHYDQMKK